MAATETARRDEPPGTWSRQLVQTSHGVMQVRSLGAERGRTLLLLHMSPLSGRQFEQIVPLLASRRRVVVPDRIGFGDSDRLVKRLEISDYAAATLECITELGVDEFDVVGMHTGSCEAVELGLLGSGRVGRVGIVGIPHVTGEERAAFKEGSRPPAPSVQGEHLDWYWALWWHATRGRNRRLAHEWASQHLAAEHAWWAFHAAFDYPIIERIHALTQPFLVIWARDEIDEVTRRALPLLPPSADVVELAHLDSDALFTDAPQELADVIEAFLDRG